MSAALAKNIKKPAKAAKSTQKQVNGADKKGHLDSRMHDSLADQLKLFKTLRVL